MPAVFGLVHLEVSAAPGRAERPGAKCSHSGMGGGARRGGLVVRASLSWGKCDSISGSVSNRHKIINRVFIAGPLCRVSPGLSAGSQQ